jgi:hypothetical protein
MQVLSSRTPHDPKVGLKFVNELGTLFVVLVGLGVCAILAPFLKE